MEVCGWRLAHRDEGGMCEEEPPPSEQSVYAARYHLDKVSGYIAYDLIDK